MSFLENTIIMFYTLYLHTEVELVLRDKIYVAYMLRCKSYLILLYLYKTNTYDNTITTTYNIQIHMVYDICIKLNHIIFIYHIYYVIYIYCKIIYHITGASGSPGNSRHPQSCCGMSAHAMSCPAVSRVVSGFVLLCRVASCHDALRCHS